MAAEERCLICNVKWEDKMVWKAHKCNPCYMKVYRAKRKRGYVKQYVEERKPTCIFCKKEPSKGRWRGNQCNKCYMEVYHAKDKRIYVKQDEVHAKKKDEVHGNKKDKVCETDSATDNKKIEEISPQRLHILSELEKLVTITQGLKKENVREHWKLTVESTYESFWSKDDLFVQNLGAKYGLLQAKYLAENSECRRLSEEIKKLKGETAIRKTLHHKDQGKTLLSLRDQQLHCNVNL